MQTLTLVFKYFYHQSVLPQAFNEYFTVNADVHCHDTRNKKDINLPSFELSFGLRCSKTKAAAKWNSLLSYLKSS
jgi:hypothetical protein